MLESLVLSAILLAQDPKPAPKTVEDRLRELAERLSTLEKKEKTLTQENTVLELEIAQAKFQRERVARQAGAAWVQRYSKPVEFTPSQASEFEELWTVWTKEELEKTGDLVRWKAREEALRSRLAPDQIPRLARRVREERVENAKRMILVFSRGAKLAQEKSAALEEAVLRRLSVGEGLLLVQAHPEEIGDPWGRVLSAVEGSVSDPSVSLAEEDRSALTKLLAAWKPQQR